MNRISKPLANSIPTAPSPSEKTVQKKPTVKESVPPETATFEKDRNKATQVATAKMTPNTLSFEDKALKKDFDDIWTFHADPGRDTPKIYSKEALRKKLGVDEKWTGAKNIKSLVDNLGENNATVFRDLAQIKNRKSLKTANQVAKQLDTFLVKNKPASEVNTKTFVKNALNDVAFPSNIDQCNRGTCTATAVQMKWALEKPTEYISAATTLAEGSTFTTAGGAKLPPDNSWKKDATDKRNLSAKVMQNALMELGNNGGWVANNYNSSSGDSGMTRDETRYALQEVFNNNDYDVDSTFTSSASILGYVEDELARGRAANISFDGHAVLVTGLDKKNDRVIINSWGEQYKMTFSEFKSQVKASITIDDSGSDSRKTPKNSHVQIK